MKTTVHVRRTTRREARTYRAPFLVIVSGTQSDTFTASDIDEARALAIAAARQHHAATIRIGD